MRVLHKSLIFLALSLAVVGLLTILSAPEKEKPQVFAGSDGDWEYILNTDDPDNEETWAILTKYNYTGSTSVTNLDIPDKVDGYTVKEIGAKDAGNSICEAFEVSSVRWKDYDYASASKITVSIPSCVKIINRQAFYNWKNLASVVFIEDTDSAVISQLRFIGSEAFAYTGITQFTFPRDVSTVKDGAFSFCYYLQTVKLPKLISELSQDVFRGCVRLNKFEACKVLGDMYTVSDDGCVVYRMVRNGVSIISNTLCFCVPSYGHNVAGATLEDGVWVAPSKTGFDNHFILNRDVKDIGPYAFEYLTVNFEEEYNFRYESSVEEFVIPSDTILSKNSFDKDALRESTISKFSISGSHAKFKTQDDVLYWVENGTASLVCYPPKREGNTFNNSQISYSSGTNEISVNIAEICAGAFYENKKITEVTISENVKSIGEFAFHGCENLVNVTFSHSILQDGFEIGEQAFTSVNAGFKVTLQNRLIYNHFLTKYVDKWVTEEDDVERIVKYFDNAPDCFDYKNPVTVNLGNNNIYIHGKVGNYKAYSDFECESEISVLPSNKIPSVDNKHIFKGFYLDDETKIYIDRGGNFIDLNDDNQPEIFDLLVDTQLLSLIVEKGKIIFADGEITTTSIDDYLRRNFADGGNYQDIDWITITGDVTKVDSNAFVSCGNLDTIEIINLNSTNITFEEEAFVVRDLLYERKHIKVKVDSRIVEKTLIRAFGDDDNITFITPIIEIELNIVGGKDIIYSHWDDGEYKLFADDELNNELTSVEVPDNGNPEAKFRGYFEEENGQGIRYVNSNGEFLNNLAAVDGNTSLHALFRDPAFRTVTLIDETITSDISSLNDETKEIIITDSVKQIDLNAFVNCVGLELVTFEHEDLSDLVLNRNTLLLNDFEEILEIKVTLQNRKAAKQLKKKINVDNLSFTIIDSTVKITLRDGSTSLYIYSWGGKTFDIYNNETHSERVSKISIGSNRIDPSLVFKGYYTETNGQGTCYVDKDGNFINNLADIDDDITLFAYWQKPSNVIWFILGGVSVVIVLILVVALFVRLGSPSNKSIRIK